MSLEDLPVLARLTALSLGHAVLHLEDGSSVEVDTKQGGVCAFGKAPCHLTLEHGEEIQVYAVPDDLDATVCAALRLYRKREGPPVLTLLSVSRQPDSVTFAAVNQEGQPVSLTMPRPVGVQPTLTMPRPVGVPVDLYVTREDTPPGHGFTFNIYPETQEGRALLELLGWWARVEASGEGQA